MKHNCNIKKNVIKRQRKSTQNEQKTIKSNNNSN